MYTCVVVVSWVITKTTCYSFRCTRHFKRSFVSYEVEILQCTVSDFSKLAQQMNDKQYRFQKMKLRRKDQNKQTFHFIVLRLNVAWHMRLGTSVVYWLSIFFFFSGSSSSPTNWSYQHNQTQLRVIKAARRKSTRFMFSLCLFLTSTF